MWDDVGIAKNLGVTPYTPQKYGFGACGRRAIIVGCLLGSPDPQSLRLSILWGGGGSGGGGGGGAVGCSSWPFE